MSAPYYLKVDSEGWYWLKDTRDGSFQMGLGTRDRETANDRLQSYNDSVASMELNPTGVVRATTNDGEN